MGIESDQLVFDYLSRVGDLAQQRQMSSGARMNLVTELREEIGRQRSKALGGEDSPAAVRRILRRIGTPDDVVDRAGVPAPRKEPRPTPAEPKSAELSGESDWWTTETGPDVPGFVGGVELAEILRPPAAEEEDEGEDEDEAEDGNDEAEEPTPEAELERRRRFTTTLSNPFLLLAAALLVVGAVMGSLLPLAGGWLLAWASRRLTPFETKLAVMGLPGLAATAGAIWIWGRLDGRWGTPIAPGAEALSEALSTTWPWVVRTAAIASALYLAWRSRRA